MLNLKLWKLVFCCHGAYLMLAASNGSNLLHKSVMANIYSQPSDTSESIDAVQVSPIKINPRVEKFALSYIKINTESLLLSKKRGVLHFRMMDSVFNSYNLPVELKYLAVIESELKGNALSHVGAAGPWQLMPGTAKILGLQVNGKVDERKNFKKSTVAAAKYINDLYHKFGDWLLVIAAYNGGPGPVYKAINKSGSSNFWKLQQFFACRNQRTCKKIYKRPLFF